MLSMDDIEVLSLNITVKMHYKNTRGLTRVAGLEFEIEKKKLDIEMANKGKWNKFIGDMVMDSHDACIEKAKEEYAGKAPEPTPEEADAIAKKAWKEQDARAKRIREASIPISPDPQPGHDMFEETNDGSE